MTLTPEKRAEHINLTKEAAAALIEDLAHLREVLANPEPSRRAVRHLSGTLRRFLLDPDRDLPNVAAPRIGRIHLLVPDNKPAVKLSEKHPLPYFQSGGARVFGIYMRAAMVKQGRSALPMEDFGPDRTARVRVDGFLSQPVLCLQNKWATRANVIEYAANVASGVHSGTPQTAARNKQNPFQLLARIRTCATFELQDGVPGFGFNVNGLLEQEPEFAYNPNALDPVLVELLCAAHYLVESPDTQQLEEMIHEELGIKS